MQIETIIAGQPGAAYIGWTPQVCSIRLSQHQASPVNIVLKSLPVHHSGGQVEFFTARNTAPQATLSLTLPADGTALQFFIAGKTASTEDQDASVIVTTPGSSAPIAKHTLMVRIRKNANHLTSGERNRFLRAFVTLNMRSGLPTYQNFLDLHNAAANHEIHTTTAVPRCSFLVWHRAYILDLERQLQKIDPSVTLPYWKFDDPAPNVFTVDFMGQFITSGSLHFSSSNPLLSWSIAGRTGIIRKPLFNVTTSAANIPHQSPISNDAATVALGNDFLNFRALEDNPHGYAHVSFASPAPLTDITMAPRDPIFFMLHCNVDRIWALWQAINNRYTILSADTYPNQGAFTPGRSTQAIGDYLTDTMWPWNGSTAPTRPPTAPGGSFPQNSFPSAPSATPSVQDMIDYQGYNGGTGCFFDYDKINFKPVTAPLTAEMDAVRTESIAFNRQSDSLSHELKNAGDDSTIKNILVNMTHINPKDNELAETAFTIVKDKNKPTDLRLQALEKLTNFLFTSEAGVADLIALLTDDKEPVELRRAAFQSLLAVSFSAPAFKAQLPAFKKALRQLLNSPDKQLREMAIEWLAGDKDELTQKKLLEGLVDPSKALVPEEEAIHLLSVDPKAEYHAVIRKMLAENKKPEVLREAIMALSADPASQDLIHKIFVDKSADKNVRLSALAALNMFDAEKFQPTLQSTITDQKESPELKIASLNTLSFHENLLPLAADKTFGKALTDFSAMDDEEIKKAADHVLRTIKKSQQK